MRSVLPLGVVILVAAVGCSRPAPSPGVEAAPVRPLPFSAQWVAVRDGRAERIVAEESLTAAEWESLRGLEGVTELVLLAGRADDACAEILATLGGLERLVLRDSPLSDAGLRRLTACRNLRDLNLPQAACTAAGVRSLAALERLRSLRLGGGTLSGPEVCRAVATLPALRSLHLIDVPIGDDGLGVLAGLPGLWNLYLDGSGVSDAAWEGYFRACPNVHVHVDQAHHDRDPRRNHDALPAGDSRSLP